jgi:hypothetical protein
MPAGFVIVDPRTVLAPDGRKYDVLDAIQELPWRAQLCPLMRHEYSIWKQGPEWAWNVLSSMLLAKNPESFRAYFRGYQSANRYWDAPDGLRYWRGRFEIDRGQPDDAGLRRVDAGAKRSNDWAGPPHAPDGIGLYEQDERGRWWPTEAALESGYQPCSSCELTNRKSAIVLTPRDPERVAAFIAAAEKDSRAAHGRFLTRDELAQLLRAYPDRVRGPSNPSRAEPEYIRVNPSVSSRREADVAGSDVSKGRVVRKLLELRAREAPLGSSAYRGVLSQKAIAEVAGVRVGDVTKAAIELDRELEAAKAMKVD